MSHSDILIKTIWLEGKPIFEVTYEEKRQTLFSKYALIRHLIKNLDHEVNKGVPKKEVLT